MTDNQILARKAASIARRAGFRTVVRQSITRRSDYLFIGFPSRFSPKGFNPIAELQITNYHAKEGWRLLGITDKKNAFTLRSVSPDQDIQKVNQFVGQFRHLTGKLEPVDEQ